MSSIHLESWVKQQYKEVGFGKGGDGPFIGKSALKQRLISRYPMHKKRIRQLVNEIKHQDLPRRAVPALQPRATPSQAKIISQSPAKPVASTPPLKSKTTTVSPEKSLPLVLLSESKSTSQSPARPQPKRVSPSIGLKMSAPSSQASDSRFGSCVEDAEKSESGRSSRLRTAPITTFQTHSSRSEDGRATLEAVLSTASKAGGISETLEPRRPSAPKPSNPKISELKKFLDELEDFDLTLLAKTEDSSSTLNLQLGLLHLDSTAKEREEDSSISDVRNAVIFPGDMLEYPIQDDLPQYGLLGSSDPTDPITISDSRLFLNTNIPFSAFVCGVQGSGKSHTTACIIENCLIPSPILGVLQKPLSALVFNFAEYTSSSSFRPCELALLASPGSQIPNPLGVKKVNVLVSPSNYLSLKALYTQIPGVTVQPFMLRPKDLNISTMLTLMSVDQTQAAPLYMGMVTKILRYMASETAEAFNYLDFRRRLDDAGLDKKQEEFLNQRLDLLESFLDLDGSTTNLAFAAGEITILDLSCPFVDASTACVLFKIGMGLYLESGSRIGKIIVLDEAHKYMTDTPASKALTESLMGVIRQQRHFGARVIISTQEPSISPKLIDLCSIIIMHRFSSPEWLDILQRHILVSDEEGDRGNKVGLLREIMKLRTGEALVFAPSAIFGGKNEAGGQRTGADKLLKMRMRKRVTWDGGRSIVCI